MAKVRDSGMPLREQWESFFDPPGILDALDCKDLSGDIVELGCGYGTFTAAAAERTSATVYALDIDPIMVAATVSIGFVSMSVWAHHMFTVGMSSYGNAFFALTTMVIAVPTGIKIFNWLGTMWGGRLQFKTPMLFCTAL